MTPEKDKSEEVIIPPYRQTCIIRSICERCKGRNTKAGICQFIQTCKKLNKRRKRLCFHYSHLVPEPGG